MNPIEAIIAWAFRLAAVLMQSTVGALVTGFRRAVGAEPDDEVPAGPPILHHPRRGQLPLEGTRDAYGNELYECDVDIGNSKGAELQIEITHGPQPKRVTAAERAQLHALLLRVDEIDQQCRKATAGAEFIDAGTYIDVVRNALAETGHPDPDNITTAWLAENMELLRFNVNWNDGELGAILDYSIDPRITDNLLVFWLDIDGSIDSTGIES